ncbi:activator of Hsp90 ATPase-like protein [Nonomuraea polychroma]|uniref:Activator of Hsp90 ATPase-like protein n=1 Tax=Nonomuraea polychroma TaxID=46176 RepID=A0A438M1V4_9ACTN|nr:SRPBCC domain-containing protein [Nonomuraea polychroma]RVX39789.1 activator of Hsp90 ATPase-like protein [Nonomuraea polychroma]
MDDAIPPIVEPIRHAIMVEADRERTFNTFIREIGSWWPIQTSAIQPGQVESVHVEEHVGGRIYEVLFDGRECDWGHIQKWDPPKFFAFSWEVLPGPIYTEVLLYFKTLGPRLTRVELVHHGWEKLGPMMMDLYAKHKAGWPNILGGFERMFAR